MTRHAKISEQAIKGLRGNNLLVYAALKLHADKDGCCFPTRETLSQLTGIPDTRISTITSNLESVGWVKKTGKGGKSRATRYQVFDEKTVTESVTVTNNETVTESVTVLSQTVTDSVTQTVTESVTGIEQTSEHISSPRKFSDEDFRLAEWMFELIKELNPQHKQPNFGKWSDTIRLIREKDKHSHREIAELFKWANKDGFWRTNILSPTKLREKWDELTVKKNNRTFPFYESKPEPDPIWAGEELF